MSSFSGIGNITCWNLFIKYVHILNGVGRDDNNAGDWAFVCYMYRIEEKYFKGIDDARHSFWRKQNVT